MDALFVYGTLAPGKENERFLKSLKGSWEPALVNAYLHPNGIGPTLGYPVLDLKGSDMIDGLLFRSNELHRLWQELDEFEGKGYCRERIWVSVFEDKTLITENKSISELLVSSNEKASNFMLKKVQAWVYALDHSVI